MPSLASSPVSLYWLPSARLWCTQAEIRLSGKSGFPAYSLSRTRPAPTSGNMPIVGCGGDPDRDRASPGCANVEIRDWGMEYGPPTVSMPVMTTHWQRGR